MRRDTAGRSAQHKPGGDREDVGDDHVPQPQRIGHHQQQVATTDRGELGAHQRRNRQPAAREHDRDRQRHTHRQRARSDRAQALARMDTILLAITHIIEQVGRARDHAERDHSNRDVAHHRGVRDNPGRKRSSEQQRVLDPLQRPAGAQHNPERHRPAGWRASAGAPRVARLDRHSGQSR
jgi:hypothetical protein